MNRRSFIRLRRTCKGMNEFIIAKSSCSEQEWGVFRLVADPNDPSKEPQLSLDRKMMNADTFRASLLDALVINGMLIDYFTVIRYFQPIVMKRLSNTSRIIVFGVRYCTPWENSLKHSSAMF